MEAIKLKLNFRIKFIKYSVVIFIFLIFLQISQQNQLDEVYEPEKNICHEKCLCNNEENTLIINCDKAGMTHILNKWPPHTKYIIATFNQNNFTELQQLPVTEALTISVTFSHCGIKTLESALFIDSVGIIYLDLSWNLLTGFELRPDVFRGRFQNRQYEPISLQQLDLSHNKIESLGTKVFEHTPNITNLNLSYNPLKIIDIQTSIAISSLLKLSSLNLANTSIQTFPETMVSRLKKLRELDVSCNLFKIVPESLEFLSDSLEILNLGENLIEHFYDQSFIGLHSLRILNISSLPLLTTIRHNTFSTLGNLQVLNCSNNPRFYHINNEAFGVNITKPQITDLNLSENNLKTLPVDLLNWSNLTKLELSGNRWHCDCQLYQTIIEIRKNNNDIVSPVASCSTPLKYAGTELDDLKALNKSCNEIIKEQSNFKKPGGPHRVVLKAILIISSLLLISIACFTFWKIMLKYKNISINTSMVPVIYTVAPTEEH